MGGTHSSLISGNRRARIRIEKTDTVGHDTGRDKREYDAPEHLKECAGLKPKNHVTYRRRRRPYIKS